MEREGQSDDEARLSRRAVMLEVNAHIREAAERLDGARKGSFWEFRCECGGPDCQSEIRLTLAEYAALRDSYEPILAPGHDISRPARARRTAREKCDDAEALKRQAEQQQGRARRNLRGSSDTRKVDG